MTNLPRGLIVELLGPRNPSGLIDWASAERLVDLVNPLADGLFLAGPEVGGGPELAPSIRAEWLALAAGRSDKPLLLFITGSDRSATLANLEAALAQAEAASALDRLILVEAPLLSGSNRGLPDWLKHLTESSGRPLILYNHPGLIGEAPATKRRHIRTSVLKRSAETVSGLTGLIYRGPFSRLLNYHQAVRSRPLFRVYDAQESRFLDRPSSAGLVSIGANLVPAVWALLVSSTLHPGRPAQVAAVLAAAKAARSLSLRLRGQTASFLRAGLTALGLLQGDLEPAGPTPEEVLRFLQGLKLERWNLSPRPARP